MDILLIVQYIWAFFLAIGPILGYIPQYIDIKRTRNFQGFSSAICFILLISNILRILSFVLKPFDKFLLAQSFFMIVVQLLILHLIVKLAARDVITASQPQHPQNEQLQDNRSLFGTFWAWKSFIEYSIFLSIFTVFFIVIILVEKFLFPSDFIKEAFLYTSTLIESTLCMPQIYTNWKNKSTIGLNKSLVSSWIAGDLFKLFYYIFTKSELPFTICAIIQICVDFAIIVQICYYKWKRKSELKETNEKEKTVTAPLDISRPSSTAPLKEP